MSDKPKVPVEVTEPAQAMDSKSTKSVDQGDAWHASKDVGDAQLANINEHNTTVRQALRAHPWAVVWTLAVLMSIIMEGYDNILIGNFFGYPAFQRQFGVPMGNGRYEIPGRWQVGLRCGQTGGSIIGAFINGWASHRFGFRPTFIVALFFMNAFIFISFFGKTIALQTVGQVLCGLPWGVFATIGPAYASEISPLAFRPYLTAYTNMCFAIGQFIGAGVLQGTIGMDNEWSYRIPFAVQWLWPLPLMVVGWYMPESPWWLVRNGRLQEAEHSLKRGMAESEKPKAKDTIAMMVHTNEIEQEVTSGTSYVDCYKGKDRWRTEIACMVFAGQVLSGSEFAYSGTYFFQQAGMSASDAYKMGLGGTAIAFVGTICAWFLMKRFGRRRIYMGGLCSMCACLIIIGFLTLPTPKTSLTWAQSILCILWLLSFSLSVGPIGWAVPAEVSSTRLRSKTIVLARSTYYITNLSANIIQPYMMSPLEFNWRGKTGFFWFGFAFLTLVWAFFRMPETKDRTFEELDLMFTENLPTRKFRTHHVDAYDENLAVNKRGKQTTQIEKL